MSSFGSPIPLSDIESVLAWVDNFKLSRPTKKINRDFSDAVLLAEILAIHYPKLVEMHNYPPRNSHSLKLNNWMTLNRKVLKKLKLNLCCNTMEQLANCAVGVIERVLVMVRDKIRRDEEANKSKDSEQNESSGGSYYEACGDDGPPLVTDQIDRERPSDSDPSATYRVNLPEHVLVVPVKTRINGVLDTVQQKVINYEFYLALKEELKDAKDSAEVLKQKVEHLDSLLKLKEERIDELQKQLERKQIRRKEAEALVNSLCVPFETVPCPAPFPIDVYLYPSKTEINPNKTEIQNPKNNEINNPLAKTPAVKSIDNKAKVEESKIPVKHDSTVKASNTSRKSITAVVIDLDDDLDRIKSDVFKDIENIDDYTHYAHDGEFKDSEKDTVTTIEETIQKEIKSIVDPMEFAKGLNC